MKPIVIHLVVFYFAAVPNSFAEDLRNQGALKPRSELHRMTLSDGSWLLINTPFPFDEQQNETLAVRIHCYPKSVKYEKQTDQCVWVANNVTSVEYLPGQDRYYALALETNDRVFVFFTWNAAHCTIDKRTGRIVEKGKGDDVLKQYGTMMPLKLRIRLRATDRSAKPSEKSADDLFGPASFDQESQTQR